MRLSNGANSLTCLDAETLRSQLHYDPTTGLFSRLVKASKAKPGDVAGCDNGSGYVRIGVAGHKYKAHRLAWLYMTGEWPIDLIDHINENPSDNRWANLRCVNNQENLQNQAQPRADSTTGFKGVSRKNNRWYAGIWFCEKIIFLGAFDNPEEAHAIYFKAKRALHPGFTP
jgi:HNH endonuclease